MFSFDIVSGGLLQLTLIFLYILYGTVCAVVTSRVMQYKGYEDYAGWIIGSLFFGVLVLIGVAGLPLAREASVPERKQEKLSKR